MSSAKKIASRKLFTYGLYSNVFYIIGSKFTKLNESKFGTNFDNTLNKTLYAGTVQLCNLWSGVLEQDVGVEYCSGVESDFGVANVGQCLAFRYKRTNATMQFLMHEH